MLAGTLTFVVQKFKSIFSQRIRIIMDLPFIKQLKGNLSGISIKKFLIVNNCGSVERELSQSEKYEVNSLKEVLSYTRLNSKEETIERHYLKYNQYSQNPEQDIVWINHEGQAKQFLIRYDIYSNQQVEEICSSMERKNLGNFVTPGTLDSGVICRVVITVEDNDFFFLVILMLIINDFPTFNTICY